MNLSLEGRFAVVTGASKGIGAGMIPITPTAAYSGGGSLQQADPLGCYRHPLVACFSVWAFSAF